MPVQDWRPMSVQRSPYEVTARVIVNAVNLVEPDVRTLVENLRRNRNQHVFVYGGMSNGVGQMVTDVGKVARPGSLYVLRIWSHGGSGGQGVSTMRGVAPAGQRAGISLGNWMDIADSLVRLRPCFERSGRLELRGCEVGAGFDGDDFLKLLARTVGVDVYAAQRPQPIGPTGWAGPVLRMKPNGARSVGSGPEA